MRESTTRAMFMGRRGTLHRPREKQPSVQGAAAERCIEQRRQPVLSRAALDPHLT